MDDKQFKAALKLLGIIALLELVGIGMFLYTYFVQGYFMVKNLAAIILGALVLIMIIVKIIQGKKS